MKTMKIRLAGAAVPDRLGTAIIRLWGPVVSVCAGTLWLSVAIHIIDFNGPVLGRERKNVCPVFCK